MLVILLTDFFHHSVNYTMCYLMHMCVLPVELIVSVPQWCECKHFILFNPDLKNHIVKSVDRVGRKMLPRNETK